MTPDDAAPGQMTALAALTVEVGRLRALDAARAVAHRYAESCDRPDGAAVAACFADDAVLTTPRRRVEGRAAIEAFYLGALVAGRRHLVSNVLYEARPDGDGHLVEGTCAVLVLERDAPSPVSWGRYTDTIRVDATGVALFVDRHIDIHGRLDLPHTGNASGAPG